MLKWHINDQFHMANPEAEQSTPKKFIQIS
jgi:hypothetical protein